MKIYPKNKLLLKMRQILIKTHYSIDMFRLDHSDIIRIHKNHTLSESIEID